MNTPPMLTMTGGAVRDYTEFKRIMGIPDTGDTVPKDLRSFGRQPADEAWVQTCMTIKASAAQSVPLRVQVKDGKNWTDIADKPDPAGDDLQYLLDDVNPAWDGAQLQAYQQAGGDVHGGCYLRKVRGRLGGAPQELHWLSGALVEVEMGPTFPETYVYRPGGQRAEAFRYKPDEIIPLRDVVNLQDPYALLSPLSAARFYVSTLRQAAEWNDALLRNWGIPAGAWVAPPEAEVTQADKSLIKRALRALRGPGNQGKSPILPAGLQWTQLSMSQKDADWIGSGKVSRMAVCAVLGVPLVLAGDDEKAGVYASVRDAERVLWRRSMITALDRRATTYNSWLVPDFDPTRKRLRVAYDYTVIEALRGAPAEEMQQWARAVELGLPFNRYIKQFGMGAPIEGGDEVRIVTNPGAPQGEARPEEYDTPGKTGAEPSPPAGGERVRALGKGLYRHPAVRAFTQEGDAGGLVELVAPEEMERLLEGLRSRRSAAQIAASLVAPATGVHVHIPADIDGEAVDLLRASLDAQGASIRADVQSEVGGLRDEMIGARHALEDAAVALREAATRPRHIRKVPVRDERGRIIRVDEVEIA